MSVQEDVRTLYIAVAEDGGAERVQVSEPHGDVQRHPPRTYKADDGAQVNVRWETRPRRRMHGW